VVEKKGSFYRIKQLSYSTDMNKVALITILPVVILILLPIAIAVTPTDSLDSTPKLTRALDRFFDWATAIGTIGAIITALLIAKRQSQETLSITEKQSKENIILQMQERLFELIAGLKILDSHNRFNGIESLKKIWFYFEVKPRKEERTRYWKTIEKNASDNEVHQIMKDFYKAYLRIEAIFGDFETLNYYYLSMFPICPVELLDSLKKLHPRELGFLAFIICVVRNDKEAATTVVKYGILDRAITQGTMPPSAKNIIEKISKGEFLRL